MNDINNLYKYSIAQGFLREKAIQFHLRRYIEVGFSKKDELDPYVQNAIYFIAQPENSLEVVGTTRLIFKPLEELPTMKNFKIDLSEMTKLHQLSPGQYAEISALTKMPQYDVMLGLIRIVLHYSIANKITHLICCIDERVYNYLHRISHFPFKVVGQSQAYLGSVCVPCALELAECMAILEVKKNSIYQYLMSNTDENSEVIQ